MLAAVLYKMTCHFPYFQKQECKNNFTQPRGASGDAGCAASILLSHTSSSILFIILENLDILGSNVLVKTINIIRTFVLETVEC